MGSEAQYLLDVHQGQAELSMEGIMESAFLGGIGGAVDIGFGGNTVFRSASVGVVGGTGTGMLGEIFPLEPESINFFDDIVKDTIDTITPTIEFDYSIYDSYDFYYGIYFPQY